MKKVNWGIVGLGKIANKFAQDLNSVSGACIYGVASRNSKKAEDFKLKHKATVAFDNYLKLSECAEVDVVYIATPHVETMMIVITIIMTIPAIHITYNIICCLLVVLLLVLLLNPLILPLILHLKI